MHLRLLASLAAGAAVLPAASWTALTVQAAPRTSCTAGTITLEASIPGVLQGAETVSFPISLTPKGGGAATPSSLAFTAGQTSRSTDVSGLAFDTYTVHETAPAGWVAQPDQDVTVSGTQCSGTASFSNALTPATATFQVATTPAGNESGWTFTLVGPGTPSGGEKLLTTGTAPVTFTTPLQEGMYTVAQTTLNGWDQTGATGCVFTVDYPADAGRTFACRVEDTEEGHVTVASTHGGQAPSGTDAFHFVLSGGPDNVLLTQVSDAADRGALDFGLLRPGGYTLCQQAPPAGWATTLVAQGGLPDAGGDICLPFQLTAGQARAFTVDTASPAVAAPTPAPTPTPAPRSGVQGSSGVQLPATGGGIAIPNTGAGAQAALAIPMLLLGGALVATGRRRERRRR
ncbi:MAG TPA: hypothetical protein VFC09_03820 [Candidatus Dormibacteraeota bacterium]|nr:hypothetical protein [Candidatus Dormibacteraeota bacterium]